MKAPWFAPAIIVTVGLSAGAQKTSPSHDAATLTVQELPSPASANSAEPQITMTEDRPILSWIETNGRRASLKFARWTGTAWSAAAVAVEADDLMLNSADVPSVSQFGNLLVAEWLQQDGPDPESYKLRLSWSKDDGRSWSAPTSPHRDTVQTQHGFGTLFPAGGGF